MLVTTVTAARTRLIIVLLTKVTKSANFVGNFFIKFRTVLLIIMALVIKLVNLGIIDCNS